MALSAGLMERLLGADLPCPLPEAVETRVLDPRLAAWIHNPDLVRQAPRLSYRWKASVHPSHLVDIDASRAVSCSAYLGGVRIYNIVLLQ